VNIKKKYLLIFLVLLAILLSSCSNSETILQNIKNEKSYTYSITAGSTLTLNQSITVAADRGRIFFQNGIVTTEKNLNIYYPHCSLTVNTISNFERELSPTTFLIFKVINDEEYAQGYMLFADSQLKTASDGPIISGLVSYYYLKSDKEPDVRTLQCIQWDSLYENRYLSISEIRKSLGNVFTLNLK